MIRLATASSTAVKRLATRMWLRISPSAPSIAASETAARTTPSV